MAQTERGRVRFFYCEGCGAHALTVPILRRILPADMWGDVWPVIRAATSPSPRRCASCDRRMELTAPIEAAGGMRLDVCDPCGLLFLDANELARMPKGPVEVRHRMPPEMGRALAKAMALEYNAREQLLFGPLKELGLRFLMLLLENRARRWDL
jgi:hypothetical protein